MKFTRVIGKIDPHLVAQAAEKLSKVFVELGMSYTNVHMSTKYGGDPLVFSLVYPVVHICTLNMPTAATNGLMYFWNPKFILKTSLKGLRMVCAHEAWHAMYMHPSRRGARNPKLWNIAVDYIVNGTVMADLRTRKHDPASEFTKYLGRYMPLKTFIEMVKNPFKKLPGFEDLNPMAADANQKGIALPGPTEDRNLTTAEQKELERREKGVRFFYADPELDAEMKRPEKIYETLYALLPKCPKCGRIGMYKRPKKGNKGEKGKGEKSDKGEQSEGDKGEKNAQNDQGQSQPGDCGHEPGDNGDPCDCGDDNNGGGGNCCNPNGPCDECGDGVDIFGLGGTLDEHYDSGETEEKMAKRISEAMEAARKLAGHIPAALEDELGKLTAPKIRWQDVIRSRLIRSRTGNTKNDWTRFRTRPMFSGLLVPKRLGQHCQFGALLDTSGSMSRDDMAFGVSQLLGIDNMGEGYLTCADSDVYWDKTQKLRKCNAEELSKIKPVGRGGTVFASYFADYEKNIGKCDFLVIMTDGYLMDSDVAEMRDPSIPVYWLITSACDFKPPFGRCFMLLE
jgi:predicted metal-dependent peptidase